MCAHHGEKPAMSKIAVFIKKMFYIYHMLERQGERVVYGRDHN